MTFLNFHANPAPSEKEINPMCSSSTPEPPKISCDDLAQVRAIYETASKLLHSSRDRNQLKKAGLKGFPLLKTHVGFDIDSYENRDPELYFQAVKEASLKAQLILEAQQDRDWIKKFTYPCDESTFQKFNALFIKIYPHFQLTQTGDERVEEQRSLLSKYFDEWIFFLKRGESQFKAREPTSVKRFQGLCSS